MESPLSRALVNNLEFDRVEKSSSTTSSETVNRPSSPRKFFARIYGNLETSSGARDREVTSSSPSRASGDNSAIARVVSSSSPLILQGVHPVDSWPQIKKDSGGNHTIDSKSLQTTKKLVKTGAEQSLRSMTVGHSASPMLPMPMLGAPLSSFPFLPIVLPSGQNAPCNPTPLMRPIIAPGGLFPAGFSAFLARRRRKEGRPRRQRTTFSTDQSINLELEYHRSEYISRSKRFELAEALGLTETQIKIWFQNRRAKDKRIEKAIFDQQCRNLAFGNRLINFAPSYRRPESCCDYCFNQKRADGVEEERENTAHSTNTPSNSNHASESGEIIKLINDGNDSDVESV